MMLALLWVASAVATVDSGQAAASGADASDAIWRPVPAPGKPARKFKFIFGPAFAWQGPVHWSYNHAGAPGAFSSTGSVVNSMQGAMAKWSAVCGVAFAYDGTTAIAPDRTLPDGAPDARNVVGWGDAGQYIDGAAAVTLGYFLPDESGGGRIYDADIVLDNTGRIPSGQALDAVAVHEVGHMLGLDHSDKSGAVMSGPPDTTYTGLAQLQADDVRGCRCLYGTAAGQRAAYTCSLPHRLDFGATPVGTASVPQVFTVFNDGNAPLSIITVAGGGAELQVQAGGCASGTVVAPGDKCTVTLVATPAATGERSVNVLVATSEGNYTVPAFYSGTTAGAATIDAVEYYNPGLDHYFVSWMGNEMAILDAGLKSHGWTRTGRQIRTWPTAQPGASPLCRYYIPPDKGNSHFYGRGSDECARTGAANPSFVLEDPAFMYMVLPVAGTCPASTTPVYRVFSNRSDANHRYTTDPAVRDAMVAQGWLAEGDGPDRVVMCAPQ
jgi:hypothetical protein